MACPVNPAAPTFVPLRPSSPLAFQNQPFTGYPEFSCQRCMDYATAVAGLRVRVARLDIQLLKANTEKLEAESQARYLLALREAVMGEATATNLADQDDFELRRSLFQANTEKDCLKIMLERAWKKIADLSVQSTSNSGCKSSLTTNLLHDTEDLLVDLLGPNEPLQTAQDVKDLFSIVKPDELNEVKEIGCITRSANDERLEVSEQKNANLEPDSLSDTSYIFHFVREQNSSNNSKHEMKEKVSDRSGLHNAPCEPSCNLVEESGSDSLTAVNSATSSPIAQNARPAELPSMQSTVPPNLSKVAPVLTLGNPTITGDSIHAPRICQKKPAESKVKVQGQRKLTTTASFSRINYPIQLYDSLQERDDIIRYYQRFAGFEEKRLPEFFHHGLQFNPRAESRNVFRTLVISNLPQSATMTEVLERIRGGVVVDAKLLDTLSITGGKTALVTFLHEQAVKALQIHLKQHPIIIGNRVAHTIVLNTPTWPISFAYEQVLVEGRETRCLEVSRYPRHISPDDLRGHLRICPVITSDRIEYMNLRDDGVLRLRFESIACAANARGVLASRSAFQGCAVRFVPDPCAQPLKGTKADKIGDHDQRTDSKAIVLRTKTE